MFDVKIFDDANEVVAKGNQLILDISAFFEKQDISKLKINKYTFYYKRLTCEISDKFFFVKEGMFKKIVCRRIDVSIAGKYDFWCHEYDINLSYKNIVKFLQAVDELNTYLGAVNQEIASTQDQMDAFYSLQKSLTKIE